MRVLFDSLEVEERSESLRDVDGDSAVRGRPVRPRTLLHVPLQLQWDRGQQLTADDSPLSRNDLGIVQGNLGSNLENI